MDPGGVGPVKPLIGVTGKRRFGRDLVGDHRVLADQTVDVFWTNYAQGVLAAGGLPVFLPMDVDPADAATRLDGLLLTGGTDIGPDRYGAEAQTDRFPVEPERDEFELAVLGAATGRRLPTLGICRGHQVVNVFFGGTLHQDVPEHAVFDQPITTRSHPVSFTAGSVLADLYGDTMDVNSLHHQTVDRLGDGLSATARGADGSVEGLEGVDLPIVTVQWHPEMLPTRPTDPVCAWLGAKASERPGD